MRWCYLRAISTTRASCQTLFCYFRLISCRLFLSVLDKEVWLFSFSFLSAAHSLSRMSRVSAAVTRAQRRDATPPLISFRHFEIDCPSRDVFGLLFPVSHPVSILWCTLPCGQYARNSKTPQWSWHVKILSYAHAFNINWQLCSALPPLLVKGLSFPPSPAHSARPGMSLGTALSQLLELSGAGKRNFACLIRFFTWFGSSSNAGWGYSPGTLLMAESRPDFLKGPLLVSLQNSGAYGFVSMQFTTSDFPAESKKSSPCRTGGRKKNPPSFEFRQHCKVFAGF